MTYETADRGPLDEQFWTNLAALGAYGERRRERYTIGSELRPARRNPLYDAPPARPRHPAQQRGAVRIPRQRKPTHDQTPKRAAEPMPHWVPGPAFPVRPTTNVYDPTKGRATPSWRQ